MQPLDTGPGAELRRNLTALANNPRSLDALIGAGRAADAMGDGEAALGFFARADEISPNDARVKAGMGSALVQMERADQALTLFSQALALGAPEVEIAGDRGLAYDMMGDPRRAQQDYALVLRRRADPEVERRMALSLAISGQREAALRVIDGQLRRHDRAAWRTQAFVLALTGDARGAEDTAGRMMPAANAQEMAPFFARLPSLSPAQKAAAVHFGRFPSDGRATQVASRADTRADPGALALARNEPIRARPQPAEPLNAAPRRRPGAEEDRAASRDRRGSARGRAARAVRAAAGPSRSRTRPSRSEDQSRAVAAPVEPPREAPAFAPGAAFTLVPGGDQPRAAPAEAPAARPPAAPISATSPRWSSRCPTRRAAVPAPAGAAAGAAPAPPRASEPPARSGAARRAANPARHWVQLAHASAQSVLPREFAAARDEAPALLGSRTAYVALTNRVNRLLVGPFDSERAARAFVGQLERRHVEAIAWTSPAGQEIERLRIANEPRSTRSQPEARAANRRARIARQPRRARAKVRAREAGRADRARTATGRAGPQRDRDRSGGHPPAAAATSLRRHPGERPLAHLAADPSRSRGRLHAEDDRTNRGPRDAFQRDRDRIIHSIPFRRLRHKTQVFVAPDGDHYRVRLTHSLEVAQIARTLARALGLNEDLTEALALAHDIGHPPFGHAGEDVLQAAMAEAGGFDHNAHTIRLLTRLESPYPRFAGLNLSWETLEGLAKHNGPVAAPPWALAEADAEWPLELGSWPGLEAQIAAIADDIAYDNHDIDDGLRAGLFTLDELLAVPLVARAWAAVKARYPGARRRAAGARAGPRPDRRGWSTTCSPRRGRGRRASHRPRRCAPPAARSPASPRRWRRRNGRSRPSSTPACTRRRRSRRSAAKLRRCSPPSFVAYRADPGRLPPEWRPDRRRRWRSCAPLATSSPA